jgi:elongation factor P
MVVNVTELTRGDILEVDGDPWQVAEVQSQTPSARGAAMIVKAKMKNLRTGQSLSKTWRGGETVSQAEVAYRQVQFLYRQGDAFAFMDLQSYDQFELDTRLVGETAGFMLENVELRTLLFKDKVIGLELPNTVTLTISETAPALKGATAQAQLKPATMETGIQVLVPPYVEAGDRIRVDTRDGRFVERAK